MRHVCWPCEMHDRESPSRMVTCTASMYRSTVCVCRQMSHALTAAKRTLELMRELLAMHKHEDPTYLIAHMKDIGRQMIEARPQGACPTAPIHYSCPGSHQTLPVNTACIGVSAFEPTAAIPVPCTSIPPAADYRSRLALKHAVTVPWMTPGNTMTW